MRDGEAAVGRDYRDSDAFLHALHITAHLAGVTIQQSESVLHHQRGIAELSAGADADGNAIRRYRRPQRIDVDVVGEYVGLRMPSACDSVLFA